MFFFAAGSRQSAEMDSREVRGSDEGAHLLNFSMKCI